MNRFNFELEKVIQEIKQKQAKKVLLQFPEGIKLEASSIVKKLESETACECIVSGETCWGGCDIDINEAKSVKADLIVHFGHAPFIKINFPILYVPLYDSKNLIPLIKKSLKSIEKFKNIGLISSIQHMDQIEKIKQYFEDKGKIIKIPSAKGYAHLSGHVIGCEFSGIKSIKKNIDAVIVLGNQFHGLGAALAVTDKPVLLIDTYNNDIISMDEQRNKFIKQRGASIERIKRSKKIGIIVGLKPGQQFGLPNVIKKGLEKIGKQVSIITMREMTPEKIYNFYDIEGFVELACPRIALDDYGKYNKPIITFKEAMVVIGKKKWVNLLDSGFL
tara:strand:+ start:486 stop:1481 length:996 start_codon:yes stop_codon:yes gene_type:complete